MARGLKFWIRKVEGLYYPCSENKGADQLRGHREADQLRGDREADLRLCFRICKKAGFLITGLIYEKHVLFSGVTIRPEEIVGLLVNSGMFDRAVIICRAFDLKLQSVFENLALR